MRIGVTGANGQLGLSLRKIAGETPQHTFVFSGRSETDITDKSVVLNWVRQNNIELVVNCAAYTAVDKAESEPEEARRINVSGPRNLGEICAGLHVKLIHISTDYVFDGLAEQPYREIDATNPDSVYGLTKLQGEKAIRETGCDALVIRTSWLYSEFGHNFVSTMLRLGKERDEIRVVNDQCGCPTYAVDLARAIVRLAERGFSGCEVCHYSNRGITTWYGFACEIFKIIRNPVRMVPIETKEYPTPAKRPVFSVLDTEKVRKEGIEIPDWKDSLKKCLSSI